MYLQVCSFTKINFILDFLLRIFETFAIHYSKYLHLCWKAKLNERLHESQAWSQKHGDALFGLSDPKYETRTRKELQKQDGILSTLDLDRVLRMEYLLAHF